MIKINKKEEKNMDVILASASPRRRELMDKLNISYRVVPSEFDELSDQTQGKKEKSENLAYGKAKDVFNRTTGDRIVIGCDTLVYQGEKRYGKPKTKQRAKEMLKELKNGYNEVVTGLCVLVQKEGKIEEIRRCNVSKVHIIDMSEEEIDKWVASGQAEDKAGAYAIQSDFCVYIDKIDGDYFGIIGLPLQQLYEILKKYL